jgi:integrase
LSRDFNVAINKRKRDGKYEVTVYNRVTGKKRYVGLFEKSADAKQAHAEAIERRADRNSTVKEFADRWTIDFPRSESTNIHNAERVKRFATRYSDKPMGSITRDMARAWCLERPGDLGSLRAMFNDARRERFIVENPFAELGFAKSKGRGDLAGDWLTVDDIEHIAESARRVHTGLLAEMMPDLIRFAAYTGLRQGELIAIEHADLQGDEIHVQRQLNKMTGKVDLPKRGKTRRIAFLPQAQEAYERLPRLHDDLVFTNQQKKMLSQTSLYGYWNPARTLAGRHETVFHELRHFCASFLLDQGVDAAAIAIQLGHSNAELIYKTYGHPSERAARNRIMNAAHVAHDGDNGRVRRISDTQ